MKKLFLPLLAVSGLGFIILLFSSMYVVNEGHIGVKTHMGKAVSQEGPEGIKIKMPILTEIKEFDVRERRMMATLKAATANQLPITTEVTLSWSMDPARVLEVFKKYGTPELFEANIIRPRLSQAAKAGLAKYQASDLITDRQGAANLIMADLIDALEDYPAMVASVQIENVELPGRYIEAVLAKEEAREAAAKETYNLERQNTEAKKEVQTANASRDAAMALADGQAYKVRTEAAAEAEAIKLRGSAEAEAILEVQKALSNNPLFVEYEKARRWNGQMPSTILGDSAGMLLNLK